MEKVKSCAIKKEGKKSDGTEYKIYGVATESGLVGQSFEELPEGEEVEYKQGEYGGKPTYTFYKQKKKQGFPQKDYKFEKRRIALECASRLPLKSSEIIQVAEVYLKWLNAPDKV